MSHDASVQLPVHVTLTRVSADGQRHVPAAQGKSSSLLGQSALTKQQASSLTAFRSTMKSF